MRHQAGSFWCCRQVYLLGLWQICSQTSRRLFSVKCHSRNQKLQLRAVAAAALSHQSVCALHTFCPNANSLVSAWPNTAKAKYYTHCWRLCACALRQLRHRGKVHFHNSEERFYWKIIVAESGVGGGRRRVLVAQTAYMYTARPANSFSRPRSHSHTHAAHTNTHTTESQREREKSWQCKISEYATFPLQRKNVG